MAVVRSRRASSLFEFLHLSSSSSSSSSLGNISDENETLLDVASKGCFGSFDTIACVRNGLLATLVTVTLLLCVGRVIKLHVVKHPQVHQFFIFYFATAECALCCVNWVWGEHLPELDFSASYLKLLQFTVVCHLHWTLATRILHKENLVKRVILPILILYVTYFTTMTVMGIATVKTSWTECFEPEWILLSFVELLFVQLFLLAGIYITKKINAVSTVESLKRAQKRDLWSVIAAYEVSALVSFVYDLTMLILGSETQSCSGIFRHLQLLYSPVFALFMIFKFMVPIWVMLCVFHPIPITIANPETVLGWSFEGSGSTSVFSPHLRERRVYKQLDHPGRNASANTNAALVDGETESRCSGTSAHMARSQTAPAFFSGLLKRGSHSTPLAPINEEGEPSLPVCQPPPTSVSSSSVVVVITQPTPCPDDRRSSAGGMGQRGIAVEQPLLESGSSRTTETSSVSVSE